VKLLTNREKLSTISICFVNGKRRRGDRSKELDLGDQMRIRERVDKKWVETTNIGERRVNEDGGREGKECAVDLRVTTF
jgi:hypothetical protein